MFLDSNQSECTCVQTEKEDHVTNTDSRPTRTQPLISLLLTHEPSVTRSDRFATAYAPDRAGYRRAIPNLRAKEGPRLDLCVRLPSGRRANVVRTRWFARFYSDVGSRQPTQTSPKYPRIRKEHASQILFCSLFAIFRTNMQDHLGRSRPSDI